jgi:hypothetical protein
MLLRKLVGAPCERIHTSPIFVVHLGGVPGLRQRTRPINRQDRCSTNEVLLELLVAKQHVLVVGGVVHDPAPQLREAVPTHNPKSSTKVRDFLFIELSSDLSQFLIAES